MRCPLDLLLLVGFVQAATTAGLHPKFQLAMSLLKNYPEDGKMIVPSNNTVVTLNVAIYSVFGLNENEVMEMNGWVKVQWRDPRLKWDPAKWGNVESVYLPGHNIWLPDVGIANAKQWENKDLSTDKNLKVEVRASGKVNFYAYFLSKTPCPMITYRFPFDQQDCPILFGTIYSRSTDFIIDIRNVTTPSYIAEASTVGQWKPVNARSENTMISGGRRQTDVFQLVQVNLILDRKPTYHIVLVILPYCLICLVAAIIFVIKEPADRFGVSLTILLAMSVYVMIVSQGAPKSMASLSVMDKFLLIQMTLLVVLTFIVVLGPTLFYDSMEAARLGSENKDVEEDIGKRRQSFLTRKTTLKWSRRCDYAFLVVYLVFSIINGSVCLIIIPMTTPELFPIGKA